MSYPHIIKVAGVYQSNNNQKPEESRRELNKWKLEVEKK